jgi:hypothetical protein
MEIKLETSPSRTEKEFQVQDGIKVCQPLQKIDKSKEKMDKLLKKMEDLERELNELKRNQQRYEYTPRFRQSNRGYGRFQSRGGYRYDRQTSDQRAQEGDIRKQEESSSSKETLKENKDKKDEKKDLN